MLDIPMDVHTVLNVYAIKYVCTHAYDDRSKEGEEGEVWVLTHDEDCARHWFREAFNCHGDLHDIISIDHINADTWIQVDFENLLYEAEQRKLASTAHDQK